jgi:hypothetical protein
MTTILASRARLRSIGSAVLALLTSSTDPGVELTDAPDPKTLLTRPGRRPAFSLNRGEVRG